MIANFVIGDGLITVGGSLSRVQYGSTKSRD